MHCLPSTFACLCSQCMEPIWLASTFPWMLPLCGTYYMSCINISMNHCMHYVNPPFFVAQLFTRVHIYQLSCQNIMEAPPTPGPIYIWGVDPDNAISWSGLLDPPKVMRSMDDEFNNLANDIDECTGYFLRLQTTALDRYQGCRLVGMHAHMLGRLVHVAINIGLTIPQVEFL